MADIIDFPPAGGPPLPTLNYTQKLEIANLGQQVEIANLKAQVAQFEARQVAGLMAQKLSQLNVPGYTLTDQLDYVPNGPQAQ